MKIEPGSGPTESISEAPPEQKQNESANRERAADAEERGTAGDQEGSVKIEPGTGPAEAVGSQLKEQKKYGEDEYVPPVA